MTGVFVEMITEIHVENEGVAIYLQNGGSLLMNGYWYDKYKPVIGGYLTQCANGFISYCPNQAFSAIIDCIKNNHGPLHEN